MSGNASALSSTSTSGSSSSGAGRLSMILDRLPWTVSESGWAYNGPFSTYVELHAAILGLAAGYLAVPALSTAVVMWALGRGSKGSNADTHWRQVAEEPAYALGAMTVGRSLQDVGAVRTIVDLGVSLL